MAHAHSATLAGTIWPANERRLMRTVVLAVAGALLLTLSAKIKLPIEPVPVTMQPLAVIGLALALGGRLAVAAMVLYLVQGAAGLPVFAGTPPHPGGLAYMVGPTGGYLAGMLLAMVTVGALADRGWARGYVSSMIAAMVGLGAIYLCGLAYIGALFGYDKALAIGLWPYIAKDMVGTALAAVAVPTVSQLVGLAANANKR